MASVRSLLSSVGASTLRLRNRQLARSWRSFEAYVGERREAMRSLRSGLRFFTSRGLALGFAGWADAAAFRFFQYRLVCRSTLRSAYRCFTAWAETASCAQATRTILHRCLCRLSRKALSSSWQTWRSFLCDQAVFLRAPRRAVAALVHRSIRLGFNTWFFAFTSQRAQASSMLRASAAVRVRLARSGYGGWAHFGMFNILRMSFRTWDQIASSRALEFYSMRRALLILSDRALRAVRSAMFTWFEVAWQRQYQIALMRRATSAIRHRQAWSAFNGWAIYAEERSLVASHMQRGLAMFSMTVRTVRTSLRKWATGAARVQSMRRSAMAVLQREKCSALRTWRDNAQFEARQERFTVCQSFQEASLRARQSVAWLTWVELTSERRLKRQATAEAEKGGDSSSYWYNYYLLKYTSLVQKGVEHADRALRGSEMATSNAGATRRLTKRLSSVTSVWVDTAAL